RRETLLAQFKTVTPKAFTEPKRPAFSWLVPVAAAAALVALVGAMLLPALSRSKSRSMTFSSAARRAEQFQVLPEENRSAHSNTEAGRPTREVQNPTVQTERSASIGEMAIAPSQSRAGGIVLPSSADFDNKQNLRTVPIR